MSDIAIRVENLSKLYHIGVLQQRHDTLRDALSSIFGRGLRNRALETDHRLPVTDHRSDELWALRDVSFEVKRGEVVGIIGRNGAGKSTLLKILSRITEPTSGRVELHGRVGSLLEVGTGFHPELTGRENIYLNGAILGMHRVEIDRQFDEIVAFAEIERFLDTPVKRYSSGMYVRLAFAVAAHLEPEILLVDEVLAVGDAAFQKKALGKMEDVVNEGRTVLFVSHNMDAILALCPRTVLMAGGLVVNQGPSRPIVMSYLSEAFKHSARTLDDLRAPEMGTKIRLTDVQLVSSQDSRVSFGQPLIYRLSIESKIKATGLSIGYSILGPSGSAIATLVSNDMFDIEPGQHVDLELTISEVYLAPRIYAVGFSIGQGGLGSERLDYDIVSGTLMSFQVLSPSDNLSLLANWGPGWGDIILPANTLRRVSESNNVSTV